MSSSTLPLEIAENGLTHCYYLSLHCRNCGDFRIGTDQNPADLYACPVCRRLSETVTLGEGGTLRPLPFWDRTEGKGAYREMLARVLRARGKGRLKKHDSVLQ